MGNAQIGSGWLYSSEEQTLVLLNLNDARNIRPQPGEEVIATVLTSYSPPAQVRIGQPASVLVSADSTITLEVGTASPPAAAAGKLRSIGEVKLSLEHLARRCGRSVYFTWFPFQSASNADEHKLTGSVEDPASLEQFDRSLRGVARDPRTPMVCLSLCPADAPEAIAMAAGQQYEVNVSASDKVARFPGLMASHAQHARMLQSLYRQSRNAQQGNIDISNASNASNMSFPSAAPPRGQSFDVLGISRDFPPRHDTCDSGAFDLPEPQQLAGYSQPGAGPVLAPCADTAKHEELTKLKKEIESTTEEANKRINQASEAIRTLKDRLTAREAEHERMRQETARFTNEADALELENGRLTLQLQRRRRVAPDVREEEVKRLKQEADVLKEQKEALVAILEDLYGAVGKGNAKEEEAGAAIAASGATSASGAGYMAKSNDKEEGWTNMLPRPSELFASGVLEAN
jgi:hypothetical protein